MHWTDALDTRQQQEVAFAREYATNYHHGTDGHSRLMLIARLAGMLDAMQAAPPLDQLIAAAEAAGAEGIWLVRGALAAGLAWTPDDPNDVRRGNWPQLRLEPPHELIVLIRFEAGDGGESGVEFRQ